MKVGIIPARGGSKRIPGKNIKNFCGLPIIAWSIQAMKSTGIFDKIIVSTDSEEIALVAIEYGAEVPYLRAKELANDFTGTTPVISDVVKRLVAEHGLSSIGEVCCMYATAPMVEPNDLIGSLNLLIDRKCDYVFAAAKYDFAPKRALVTNAFGFADPVFSENIDQRSQDMDDLYHDAGQFYWGSRDSWLNCLPIFGSKSKPFFMPRLRVQDIDNLEDWDNATVLFELLNKSRDLQRKC